MSQHQKIVKESGTPSLPNATLAMLATLLGWAFLGLSAFAQDVITNVMSPVVSYQFYDSLGEDTNSPIISPIVSYRFDDSLEHLDTNSVIMSPVASYQYFDWPHDSILSMVSSLPVSYFFGWGAGRVVIIVQPAGQFVQPGGTATLAVAADGLPPLNYQWRYHGQDIAGATDDHLTLQSVGPANSGDYSVLIWNAASWALSAFADLAVLADGANGTQPAQISPRSSPVLPDGVDSLVVVTHGWQPFWESLLGPPTARPQWMTDLCGAIQTKLPANWAVIPFDWLSEAWTVTPDQAKLNAHIVGTLLGENLAAKPLKNLHLIGHSAGAELADSAARVVRQQSIHTIVHCTFLDPFTGAWLEGRSYYGQAAHWADNYFVVDFLTDIAPAAIPFIRPSLPCETSGRLDWAYNVDAGGALQAPSPMPVYYSGIANSTPPVINTSPSPTHWSPAEFYLATVTGTAPDCAAGYGFPLSREAGGSASWAAHPCGDPPLALCGNLSVAQEQKPTRSDDVFDFSSLPTGASGSGVKLVGNGSASLSADAPAWLAVGLTVTNTVNFIQFDAQFTDTNNADGLMTVYWNTSQIGLVDERVEPPGLQNFRFSLPSTAANGLYVVTFRLDAFSEATSLIITNVATGFFGITEPVQLDMLLAGSNGAPVLKLQAPSGFNYLVQSSTNLLDWAATALLVNTNGTVLFPDPAATNYSSRFYRALIQ